MQFNIPKPQISIVPTVKSSRPPIDYLDLLQKSESEFRKHIREIESSNTFQKLISEGKIVKRSFRGRIPRHIYQEFQDEQFVNFLNENEIEDRGDWQRDFFADDAYRRSKSLAQRYAVPHAELIKAIDYCQYLKRSWAGKTDELDREFFRSDREPSAQFTITDDFAEITERLSQLIEVNQISRDEFVKFFMSDQIEANEIASELDLPLYAINEILDLNEQIQLMSSSFVNVASSPSPIAVNLETEPIAVIRRHDNPPRAEVEVKTEIEYDSRYQIVKNDGEISSKSVDLISKLERINQRKSVTFRVLMFIYEFQYRYFASGDRIYLRPLSQAEIARQIGEHESTISRILRQKQIDTTDGILSLKFFCQGKGDVIYRLIDRRETEAIANGERDRPFNDAEIAEILEKDYATKISRRTVTYYRNKFKDAPKFYDRARSISDLLKKEKI